MPNTYGEEAQFRKLCELETRMIAIEKKLAAVLAMLAQQAKQEQKIEWIKWGGTD